LWSIISGNHACWGRVNEGGISGGPDLFARGGARRVLAGQCGNRGKPQLIKWLFLFRAWKTPWKTAGVYHRVTHTASQAPTELVMVYHCSHSAYYYKNWKKKNINLLK